MGKKKNNPAKKPRREKSTEMRSAEGRAVRLRGEAIEAEFLAKASGLGFAVARPWGQNRYDFVTDYGHGFLRVQVKGTTCRAGQSYRMVLQTSRGRAYTKEEIDFLVAYLIPENLWYVLPIEAFEGRCGLEFNPYHARKAKYEKYLEAWCLLASPREARGQKDIPLLCRNCKLSVRCAVCPLTRKGTASRACPERSRRVAANHRLDHPGFSR